MIDKLYSQHRLNSQCKLTNPNRLTLIGQPKQTDSNKFNTNRLNTHKLDTNRLNAHHYHKIANKLYAHQLLTNA